MTTLTYAVAGGNASVTINTINKTANKVSFQVSGDGAVNGAVAIKLQESNTAAGTFKDVSGATATVNTSTDEYVDGGDFNSGFLQFDVAVGSATLGTITFVVNYK